MDRHIMTLIGAGEDLSVEGDTCVPTAMFLRPQVLWGTSTTRARSQLGLNPGFARDGSVIAYLPVLSFLLCDEGYHEALFPRMP